MCSGPDQHASSPSEVCLMASPYRSVLVLTQSAAWLASVSLSRELCLNGSAQTPGLFTTGSPSRADTSCFGASHRKVFSCQQVPLMYYPGGIISMLTRWDLVISRFPKAAFSGAKIPFQMILRLARWLKWSFLLPPNTVSFCCDFDK